jgi:hypothetical protein
LDPTSIETGTEMAQVLSDENTYFVNAKRIRISVKSKESGEQEKREVNVHLDCLKQLELMKAKKASETGE